MVLGAAGKGAPEQKRLTLPEGRSGRRWGLMGIGRGGWPVLGAYRFGAGPAETGRRPLVGGFLSFGKPHLNDLGLRSAHLFRVRGFIGG